MLILGSLCVICLSTRTLYSPTILLKSKQINKITKHLIRRAAIADLLFFGNGHLIYRHDFSTQGIKEKLIVQTTILNIKYIPVFLGRELNI